MSRVWSSENATDDQHIYMKLEPEKIYQITDVKTIQTKNNINPCLDYWLGF